MVNWKIVTLIDFGIEMAHLFYVFVVGHPLYPQVLQQQLQL